MADYGWFLAEDAALALDSLTRRERTAIDRHIQQLADFPEQTPDYEVHVGAKDFVKVKRFNEWSIRWWIDDPVKEIQILAIEKVRRSR